MKKKLSELQKQERFQYKGYSYIFKERRYVDEVSFVYIVKLLALDGETRDEIIFTEDKEVFSFNQLPDGC